MQNVIAGSETVDSGSSSRADQVIDHDSQHDTYFAHTGHRFKSPWDQVAAADTGQREAGLRQSIPNAGCRRYDDAEDDIESPSPSQHKARLRMSQALWLLLAPESSQG